MKPQKSLIRAGREPRRDLLLASILVLLTLLCGLGHLSNTCYWGDDFAAYISEAIAIADGNLDAQLELNSSMHPSYLPPSLREGPLCYVWGYPLLLAGVYKLVGFDRAAFANIFYYKLPTVICFALLAGIIYIFLRRNLPRRLSFTLAAFFCAYEGFYEFMDTLYSDLVFLFFFMLALWLIECFISEAHAPRKAALGVAAGLAIWCAYEVRLNGIAILLAAVLAQGGELLRRKRPHIKGLLLELVPYIIFAAAAFAASLLLPSPTKDSGVALRMFIPNLKYYIDLIVGWLGLLFINPVYVLLRPIISANFDGFISAKYIVGIIALAICILGLICRRRRTLHFAILFAVYYIAVCALPYQQGLRYIYPLLPILLMYFGMGLEFIIASARRLLNFKGSKAMSTCALLVCLIFAYIPIIRADAGIISGHPTVPVVSEVNGIYRYNIYSQTPVEVYNYIQDELPQDCVIGFFKPRALYLNTGRISIPLGVDDHTADEVDYCLSYHGNMDFILGADFELIYENGEFQLYKRLN